MTQKKSSAENSGTSHVVKARVPYAVDGIQINFCKNASCPNFGVPVPSTTLRGAAAHGKKSPYTIVAHGKGEPAFRCNECGEIPPLKSNAAIAEELRRMAAPFREAPLLSCPHEDCANHGVPVGSEDAYYAFGKTAAGAQRYRCRLCNKTFSIGGRPSKRQRSTHKNRDVFMMLMNRVPIRRVMRMTGLSADSLYRRIDFIHRQCEVFAADRERKLPNLSLPRLYIGVDRQEYVINWAQRKDRRNVVLTSVASADNTTGYVFGFHLNFDSVISRKAVEADALAINDAALSKPFRKYARLWLDADYTASAQRITSRRDVPGSLESQIQAAYVDASIRDDVEAFDQKTADQKLPDYGMQVHAEYTLYGHFFYLKNLLAGVEKLRFFLDQDSGIRGACLGAFQQDIATHRVEAFYVSIAKNLTVDQKRELKRQATRAFAEAKKQYEGLSDSEITLLMLKGEIAKAQTYGQWKDRWVKHPWPSMAEPEKATCWLTEHNDFDADHVAWLYNKASLHAVDNFFQKVRRSIAMFERPVHSASSTGRVWNGYAAYNPAVAAKLLAIYRVVHNFVELGDDKKTPAMRLGLANAPIDFGDILYFE